MKVITYKFEGVSHNFRLLLEAYVNSWTYNASIELLIHTDAPPKIGSRLPGFYYNNYKLKRWYDIFCQHKQDMIFTDCDMLCLADIQDGFDLVDHIGVCSANDYPFNGGVVFAKNTKETHRFFQRWLQVDKDMLHNYSYHFPWMLKYAGINQSSFGYLYECEMGDMITVMPQIYNLCSPWKDWQNAKMIHVKSKLRESVMQTNPKQYSKEIQQLTKLFWSYATKATTSM